MPARKKDWTKGMPQICVFVRTASGGTIEMVADRATEEESQIALALIAGVHRLPKKSVRTLISDYETLVRARAREEHK